MELDQLRHFVKVAEHGGFSKTASVLGISQPLLSRQIRGLEVELRKTLFHRHGRGIELTEAGTHFLEIARNVIHQIECAPQMLADAESELSGRFVLGLTPPLSRVMALPVVRAFSLRFPLAKLGMVTDSSRALCDGLTANRLDAAFVHNQAGSDAIEAEPFYADPLCLITRNVDAPQADALPITALSGMPLIFPAAPHPLRSEVTDVARRCGVTLDIPYEVDGLDTILEMVAEGFGHTISVPIAARLGRFSSTLTATPLDHPALTATVSLASSRRRPQSLLHARVVDLLREVFADVHQTPA